MAAFVLAGNAQAKKSYRLLYKFASIENGWQPIGKLLLDNDGNIYGTTSLGGNGGACQGGCGTVFELARHGGEMVLHSFNFVDGSAPQAGVISDPADDLFGTTMWGGKGSCSEERCGTVFKIGSNETAAVLYSFRGKSTDGHEPVGGLIADAAGNFYGTTWLGGGACGRQGCGTVFKLAPDGGETILYAFRGGADDGAYPRASLTMDSSGNLYGTTTAGGGSGCGGSGCGTIFKLAPDGAETVLHAFQSGNDGAAPYAALITDVSGNLYGTTSAGGGTGCNGNGCGTVFKLALDGSLTVIYAFQGGDDGATPYGALVLDKTGNFFGTTYSGGDAGELRCGPIAGCGTVFELAPNGTETILKSFSRRHEHSPQTGLVADKKGNLYGVADSNTFGGAVFEIAAP